MNMTSTLELSEDLSATVLLSKRVLKLLRLPTGVNFFRNSKRCIPSQANTLTKRQVPDENHVLRMS